MASLPANSSSLSMQNTLSSSLSAFTNTIRGTSFVSNVPERFIKPSGSNSLADEVFSIPRLISNHDRDFSIWGLWPTKVVYDCTVPTGLVNESQMRKFVANQLDQMNKTVAPITVKETFTPSDVVTEIQGSRLLSDISDQKSTRSSVAKGPNAAATLTPTATFTERCAVKAWLHWDSSNMCYISPSLKSFYAHAWGMRVLYVVSYLTALAHMVMKRWYSALDRHIVKTQYQRLAVREIRQSSSIHQRASADSTNYSNAGETRSSHSSPSRPYLQTCSPTPTAGSRSHLGTLSEDPLAPGGINVTELQQSLSSLPVGDDVEQPQRAAIQMHENGNGAGLKPQNNELNPSPQADRRADATSEESSPQSNSFQGAIRNYAATTEIALQQMQGHPDSGADNDGTIYIEDLLSFKRRAGYGISRGLVFLVQQTLFVGAIVLVRTMNGGVMMSVLFGMSTGEMFMELPRPTEVDISEGFLWRNCKRGLDWILSKL